MEEHRREGMEWRHANTSTSGQKIEREYGIRFTELLRLSYFDTVRFSVVDPMHNVLLGTAKLMVTLWKDQGLLSSIDFEKIQSCVNKFVTPPDIGRIPHKISSGFSFFTADQWKNWALIFSLVALKPTLPDMHYRCWCIFVQACHLLCSRAICHDKVVELNSLLIRFCRTFELLYGADSCTPNLHLHCHLMDCLLDYGPGNSFWLFACERLNGILGSVPTNHQAIEAQLMQKFISSLQVLQSMASSEETAIKDLLRPFHCSRGSLKHEELPELPLLTTLSVSNAGNLSDHCQLLPPIKEGCLCKDDFNGIESTLKVCFGNSYVRTLLLHKYSRAVRFSGELYGSLNSIHSSSALVCAKSNTATSIIRPGFVRKYVMVDVILQVSNNIQKQQIVFLASIDWLSEHEQKHWFGTYTPVEVWQNFLADLAPNTFILITNMLCRCAYLTDKIRFNVAEDPVTIVVPLHQFAGL